MIISLGRRLPGVSSSRPERRVGPNRPARPRAPRQSRGLERGRSAWPCSGWGLPSQPGRPGCWCALTAPFHPYRDVPLTGAREQACARSTDSRGGLLSVALSRALRPVGVADHPVLWSPDFPLPSGRNATEGIPYRLAAAVRPAPRPPEPYRNGWRRDRRSIIPGGSLYGMTV